MAIEHSYSSNLPHHVAGEEVFLWSEEAICSPLPMDWDQQEDSRSNQAQEISTPSTSLTPTRSFSSSNMGKKRTSVSAATTSSEAKKKSREVDKTDSINNGSLLASTIPPPPTVPLNDTDYRYCKQDKGPYKLLITMQKQNGDNPFSPPMLVEIARALTKMGINFTVINKISRSRLEITFSDWYTANETLNNQFIKQFQYKIELPWYWIFRKVVIKGIPLDLTPEEIWNELRASNLAMNFDHSDIFRIRGRRIVNGEPTYVESTAVRMKLRASNVPHYVYLWKCRLAMTPFIPNIRQYFNCGQLSHSKKFCTNTPKCLNCGQDSHGDGVSCPSPMCCLNCGGEHRALARICPEVIFKKKTTELMAVENIDYNSAKKIVAEGGHAGEFHSWKRTPDYDLASHGDFPRLKAPAHRKAIIRTALETTSPATSIAPSPRLRRLKEFCLTSVF